VTDEEAEALINQKAPELGSTTIESVQPEHAAELGQAEQQAHDVIERLLRKLATTEIRPDFESIYARIYGSQVAALQTLREAPNGPPRASVEVHLAQVKNVVSTRLVVCIQSLPFEEWSGYLQQQRLAESAPTSAPRSVPTSATTSPPWAPAFSPIARGSAMRGRASNACALGRRPVLEGVRQRTA
jgi:hypothetical protein